MELNLEPIPCTIPDIWPHNEESQWLTNMVSNIFLAAAFSISYFVEESWIWIRILLLLGQGLVANLAIQRCQIKAFIWSLLFLLVNIYKLASMAFKHRPLQVPNYLNVSLVLKLFKLTAGRAQSQIVRDPLRGYLKKQ